MSNDLKAGGAARIFVTLSTPDKYLEALAVLLDSLILTQTNAIHVEVGCLGWTDKLIAHFCRQYPDYHFRVLGFMNNEPLKEQAIRWKPRFFLQVLDRAPDGSTLIFTDADHIVLRDLEGLFVTMSRFDLGIRRRIEHQARNLKYAAGIFGAVKTGLGSQAIHHWNELIDRSKDQWFVDQTSLVDLVHYCENNGVRLWNMDDSTLSIDTGNRDAYIWSRSNWELKFEDRMTDNRMILKELI